MFVEAPPEGFFSFLGDLTNFSISVILIVQINGERSACQEQAGEVLLYVFIHKRE